MPGSIFMPSDSTFIDASIEWTAKFVQRCPRDTPYHRLRSNQELLPIMATLWSMTHSPTPRYLSTQLLSSLLSAIFSDLKLGLSVSQSCFVRASPQKPSHVNPVLLFTPARKAEMRMASNA